jgi:hypothetical protein
VCLIIDQNKTTPLTDDEIAAIYRRNQDGMGAVYTVKGRLKAWRYVPENAADAIRAYRATLAQADDRVVLHWRYATHGVVSPAMAHPFALPFGAYLVHNGVLVAWGAKALPGESDTACLVRHIVAAATHASTYDDPRFRSWLAAEANGSAILIVRRSPVDGSMVVDRFGNAGIDHNNRWLSNSYAGPASLYPAPDRPAWTWASSSSSSSSSSGPLRLDRSGIPWGPGHMADLVRFVQASGWHGSWALGSSDPDIVAWGIGEWLSEQRDKAADGLDVSLKTLHGGRVMVHVTPKVGWRDGGFRSFLSR